MSGQIVDASLVPAPSPRTTDAEKAAIKAGKTAQEIWLDRPAKAAQKDTDARWTLKIGGKIRYRPDGTPLPQIALPMFGYNTHVSTDRRFGFIRKGAVTSGWLSTAGCCAPWSTRQPRRQMSGPTPRIADRTTRSGWRGRDWSAGFIVSGGGGQSGAARDGAGERAQVFGALRGRACLRAAKGQVRAVHPHDPTCAG
jgi:uncharacterized membrane protein YgcG